MDTEPTTHDGQLLQEPSEVVLGWETYEFDRVEKGKLWYIGWIVGLLVAAGYFVYSRDWIAIITVICAGFVVFKILHVKPEIAQCKIYASGVEFNGRFFGFTDIHSFAINYGGNKRVLQLFSSNKYMFVIKVSLPNDLDPVILKRVLIKHIPEQSFEEDFIDSMARLLKI